MVKELDNLTYGDMTKWKQLARFINRYKRDIRNGFNQTAVE